MVILHILEIEHHKPHLEYIKCHGDVAFYHCCLATLKNINLTGAVTQNCLFSSDKKIYNYSKCFKLNPNENFLEQNELSMVLRKFSDRFSIVNRY